MLEQWKYNTGTRKQTHIGKAPFSRQRGLLFSIKENEMDVRLLSKGMYYFRCLPVGQTTENEVKKIIIE
jgi:hypothetical protein